MAVVSRRWWPSVGIALAPMLAALLFPPSVGAAPPVPPDTGGWVQNHRETTVWAGDEERRALAPAPQWTRFRVAGPQVKMRVPVVDDRLGVRGWVDALDVGPVGPPSAIRPASGAVLREDMAVAAVAEPAKSAAVEPSADQTAPIGRAAPSPALSATTIVLPPAPTAPAPFPPAPVPPAPVPPAPVPPASAAPAPVPPAPVAPVPIPPAPSSPAPTAPAPPQLVSVAPATSASASPPPSTSAPATSVGATASAASVPIPPAPPTPSTLERWLQVHRPTPVWSAATAGELRQPLPQWTYLRQNGAAQGARLPVFEPLTKATGWVDVADVGPAGPPMALPPPVALPLPDAQSVGQASLAIAPVRRPGVVDVAERWVDVDLAGQRLRLMEGDRVVRAIPVTTGKAGFRTPSGTFRIYHRVEDDTMDSATVGIDRDSADGYLLKGVRYSQYFADGGFALHANYWQPTSVFGQAPTSHGCVGMTEADATAVWAFAGVGTTVHIH